MKFFSLKGRMNRRQAWLNALIAVILVYGITFGVHYLAPGEEHIIPKAFLICVCLVMGCWVKIRADVMRCHDIGKSGWWVFMALAPVLGIIWGVYLYLKKGQKGQNYYG